MNSLKNKLYDIFNKSPIINEHKYKIPISFGDEDIDHTKYIFMKYEQLLKIPISKFIAIIIRNGYIDKDSFFTIDVIYEYRTLNYTFSGYIINPNIYHVYTLWDSDGMPIKCDIINNIKEYIESIKSCKMTKIIWRVPYSSLVHNRYDDREYKYHSGHIHIC